MIAKVLYGLSVVMVALKLLGLLAASWFTVLTPALTALVIQLVTLLIVGAVASIAAYRATKR